MYFVLRCFLDIEWEITKKDELNIRTKLKISKTTRMLFSIIRNLHALVLSLLYIYLNLPIPIKNPVSCPLVAHKYVNIAANCTKPFKANASCVVAPLRTKAVLAVKTVVNSPV